MVFIFFLAPCLSAGAQEGVTQQVDGFTLEGFSKTGERSWQVNGATADVQNDVILISDVDANAYGDNTVNIKAKTGEYDKTSGNVRLKEDVVVTMDNGGQLKTDTLDWDKQTNMIVTDEHAVITDDGLLAKGKGLKASPDRKVAQLNENVTVEVETASTEGQKEKIYISCDGPMEIDQLNNVAVLKDNVVAVRGDQTLKADHAEVHFDPETKKIATIICTDNVSVTRGGNTSYSDKAIYSAADQKVIFVGRPKLILEADNTKGDPVLFGD
ncbi:MAG TPA: LPS export ABC transporter periplasmic protein LptC [Candidatus Omnitrophota bacterium]|nr:LPS export ABC transporter periplasmic protein LptC [Candidatus Omnitrophota bacterium]